MIVAILAFQPIEVLEKCFIPAPENITAVPTYHSNDNISVTLHWNSSVKESNNIKYCYKARTWRVRVVSFHNVQSTPPDFYSNVNEFMMNWIYVNGYDTWHKFTSPFNNYTYYQFYIMNNVDYREYTKAGSYVYFFGKQGILFFSCCPHTLLILIEKPAIKKPQHSIFAVNQFSSISTVCTATGYPLPTVKWISAIAIDSTSPNGILNIHNVTFHKAVYYCIAENVMVNPPLGKRAAVDIWTVTFEGISHTEYIIIILLIYTVHNSTTNK